MIRSKLADNSDSLNSVLFLYQKIPLRFTHRRQGDCSEVYAATEKAEKELGWR